MQPHHGHDDHHDHHGTEFTSPEAAAFAELEAEVFEPLLVDALAVVADHAGSGVRRIIDIGSGPGVGTCALAHRFAEATVVAVDSSPAMLAGVVERARREGVENRVEARTAELPAGLGGLGGCDVVWASMSLHHVTDQATVLRSLASLLGTGGLLALVEFGDPLRLLSDDADLSRPGLWTRIDEARPPSPDGTAPPRATAYPDLLAASGFDMVIDQPVTVRLDVPLDAPARDLAQRYAERFRRHPGPLAEPADLAVLDALLAGDADPILHVSRRLYLARPSSAAARSGP